MPELPEIETLKNSLTAEYSQHQIDSIIFYRNSLRDEIPVKEIEYLFTQKNILAFKRRSKYLIIEAARHSLLLHLGMSGKLLALESMIPDKPHTHFILVLKKIEQNKTQQKKKVYLHYIDPRRFGRLDYAANESLDQHRFFKNLGVEPLEIKDLGEKLSLLSSKISAPIKNFIMKQEVVVGVGNIYASESLFQAKIHPLRSAKSLSPTEFALLARCIQQTLRRAIKAGGTTLRDFAKPDGSQGYFKVKLYVYDRAGEPCVNCKNLISIVRLAGRSTYFCSTCQN
ncbi:MAG: bifunctional DNA-formamidopyrimidine glycosylase/DNA-(apurinic or apyrimidinic site) lyase [Oligoflexales bacterium]|nr:bifunctional DNA-formamidopyrimidine glycosylase/DNA-(apurinic or apyrimidinic site) lyase [Oligoflexales bacterium]